MNTLETHVLNMIGESTSSPDVFSDTDAGLAPIRDSLNDAIEEINMLTGSVKRTVYIPLQDSCYWYSFSLTRGEFCWISDIWVQSQKRQLTQTSFITLRDYNPRWMYNEGTPERYAPVGSSKFCIHPAPSSSGDVLECNIVITPERYDSDYGRIHLRDSMQWAAVHYAVSQYWASRGDAESALYHHGLYLEKVPGFRLYPETNERAWKYRTEKT